MIVSKGGYSATNQTGFASTTTGVKRDLYWTVPYDSVASRPCSSPAITTSNQFTLSSDVDMFMYTPCDITFSNMNKHFGQIYGGSNVTITNKYAMQFRPAAVFTAPPWPSAAGARVESYKVDLVYKRER